MRNFERLTIPLNAYKLIIEKATMPSILLPDYWYTLNYTNAQEQS